MKKIAISQSNYIPWKGYFNLIDSVDEFIIYDVVQYTKNDWRNRNKIKTYNGVKWITIPVNTKDFLNKNINEISISDSEWYINHLNVLKESYKKSPFYNEVFPWLENVYEECLGIEFLTDINKHLLMSINSILDIQTIIKNAGSYNISSDRNQRLIDICLASKATHYLSGPAAKSYLDEELFTDNGIQVEWMSYDGYPEYSQLYGEFEHGVSILDLLFNVGLEDSKNYFKKRG